MSVISRYRHWYQHEQDCNAKLLTMLRSVPTEAQKDPRYQRAVDLAAHLAACRENWLDRMTAGGNRQTEWFPAGTSLDSLDARFAAIEKAWANYLKSLSEQDLSHDFDYIRADGVPMHWSIEGQIAQLLGHAFYHRGQIAMIVDDLGGEHVDTDYLFWMFENDARYGEV